MGKNKGKARTKNNVKPSSSARAAELLGAAATSFAGFSASPELGMIAFTPGFSAFDTASEHFDPNVDQMILQVFRKMMKKDPVTKQKALQEFIDMIKTSDNDKLNTILPLWPKHYQTLAIDSEHNVREATQRANELLVMKCKKSARPYIKFLFPSWMTSQFDVYATVASVASASFKNAFAATTDKTSEVCVLCQQEIVQHITQNLTYQTAALMASSLHIDIDEAERKYHLVLLSNLRALGYFIERTSKVAEDALAKIQEPMRNLMSDGKFWSLSKNKSSSIKSAWFETCNQLLESSKYPAAVAGLKAQLITICFNNLDETDAIIAPNVWVCILAVQNKFEDWYQNLDFKKTVVPRIKNMLKNGLKRHVHAVCPHLLPFISKIDQDNLKNYDLYDFYVLLFDHFKTIILDEQIYSKSDYAIITKTFFECLRYVLKKLCTLEERTKDDDQFAEAMLNDYLLDSIVWFLNQGNSGVKYFFQHTSSLISYMDRNSSNEKFFYKQLLDIFWTSIFDIMEEQLNKHENDAARLRFLEHTLELVHNLHAVNPFVDDHKVKFASVESYNFKTAYSAMPCLETVNKTSVPTPAYIQKEVKQLSTQLLQICMEKAQSEKSLNYIQYVYHLITMFRDEQFYKTLAPDENLITSLNAFVGILKDIHDEKSIDILLNLIFQILESVEHSERFNFVEQKLLQLPGLVAKAQVLQRMLSHPLNTEKEVLAMLSKPEASAIISQIAKQYVIDNNQEKFNILHKCFFQNDKGEILINTSTVDSILKTFIEALSKPDQYQDVVISCGSFIAQVMPIICSNENASKSVQSEVFLALFAFTMQNEISDFISKDTLWELTTCWQDALSSDDIVVDEIILQKCYEIIEKESLEEDILAENLETKAEAIAKFIICATENIEDEKQRYERIDEFMLKIFKSEKLSSDIVTKYEEQVLFLEALQHYASAYREIKQDSIGKIDYLSILKRTLLNFMTILKLICSESQLTQTKVTTVGKDSNMEIDNDEVTEDFCDPNENLLKHYSEVLYSEILKSMKIAALGDSLIAISEKSDCDADIFALELSENVRQFMRSDCEIVPNVVERLMLEAAETEKVNQTACRALSFLVHWQKFAIFEENALVLLNEHLSDYFIDKKAYAAYVLSLEYILPNLEQRTITLQDPIMRCEPEEIRIQTSIFRCLFLNNFNGTYNELTDKNIITTVLDLIAKIYDKQHFNKELLLFNTDIHVQPFDKVIDIVEYINLLNQVLKDCPRQLSISNWDTVRLGLTSWILSVSKSIKNYDDPKVALFIVAVFNLFASLIKFLNDEKGKSSTANIQNVVDEWNNVFAREVNVVLFKSFYTLLEMDSIGSYYCFEQFITEITPAIELIEFPVIYSYVKNSTVLPLDNVVNFLLKNLSNPVHEMRLTCLTFLKGMNQNFISEDVMIYDTKNDDDSSKNEISKWHYFNRFEDYISRYELTVKKYLNEFSFKTAEIDNFSTLGRQETIGYLYLWDFIIYACDNSPMHLRAVYSQWLHDNRFEENFLHFLFRSMPPDILKDHCNKVSTTEYFKRLEIEEFRDPNLPIETYACHLYAEVLRKLPALVRTWWSSSESRQKTFVDKLTRTYVSSMLCNEELKGVSAKKEKHDNMQITVLTSTREMLAVYSIDEVRMELVVTLAPNHPLGGVKVVLGKQIGGRASTRNVGMQLTLFLTHQNGSLFDGLTLWKNNLDKKFSGVEECFVCYNVIHQETCQLPKVSCRTCKKKFHSPCLYKWFTTSSKSSCPICRNIF